MDDARPWKITFVTNEACNLRCRHCYAWRTGDRRTLPTATILGALEELDGWVGRYTLFLAGGEPTLRDDLPAIIAAAASAGNRVSLATNGARVDEAAADALVAAGLGHVDVALDAIDAVVHDDLRGTAGAHAGAERAIRALARARAAAGRAPPHVATAPAGDDGPGAARDARPMYLNAAAVVCRDTVAGLPALVDHAAGLGVDRLLLQPVMPPFWSSHDEAWLMRSPLWPDDLERLDHTFDALIDRKRAGGPLDNDADQLEGMRAYFHRPRAPAAATTPPPPDAEIGPRALAAAGADLPPRIDRCRVGQMALNVNHRGEVRLCHNMPPIGDLHRGSLREIWTSPAAAAARERIAHCHEGCYLLNCNYCD